MIEFLTGFLIGSNLSSNRNLFGCKTTLENNIIVNLITVEKGVLSGDIDEYFTAAYALYSFMYYTNDLVNNCVDLSL
jgi:hypothetical protein